MVILKLILDLSVGSNLFHFINLNSLLAGNCEKFHLVKASVVSNNIDIFCISEAFIESSVYKSYDGLNLKYYTLVWNDHSSETNRGFVAIYHKNPLPVIRKNDVECKNSFGNTSSKQEIFPYLLI